ncbi:UbiH/UbiF/VisC/COQ6 family ubiquinone biosynthesis hydroxylase [Fontimonas sp. SYSU GA230001]|uniref:UbiH/UbiF/VisC/COQ6 family ubiquinone biosynthesis hydroxylase n=1 Tax=Fontimonas sp. SYSU GA230001 TaxID=3142450 RepID=UPI0032B3733E
MATDCDVAVVGAGLVGAAIAVGLHRLGLRVRLLDRGLPAEGADDYDLRVYAISPASAQFLDDIGAWNAIVAERVSAYTHMQVWEAEPGGALHFDASDVRLPALGHIVESRVIQRHLLDALPAGVLREGVTVTACEVDDGAATLRLARGAPLRASLVVAADGARSPLREAVGIEVMGHPYEQTAVVCHVRTERPHRATAYQRFLDTGPLALLPLADGRSSIVWSSVEAPALMALDDAAFCEALGEACQHVLGRILDCTRRLAFPLALQQAQDYVRPRCVLAGDAAHVVHPLAGQGVNLGFGDAQCLIETLAGARRLRRDIGGLRVLQRYQRSRKAAVVEMMAVTDGLYRAYRFRQPAWQWLRQRGLSLVGRADPLRQALVRRACGL